MSQATQNIPNSSGYNFRQAVIALAKALSSIYYGTTDPTTETGFTSAHQFWLDATNSLAKQLATDGATWISKGSLDSNGTVVWYPTFLNTSFSGDFHLQTTAGTFVTSAVAQTNAPNSADLFWLYVVVDGSNILHFAVSISSGQMYTEYYNGTAWSSGWYSPLTTASLLATNITSTAENLVTATNVQDAITQLSQASYITNTATGGITTTNVQSSLAQLDSLKAPLTSPAFLGTPTTQTPAQFNASTQIANGASVMAAAGAMAGIKLITASTTLTAADNGKVISCNNVAGITLTLPTAFDQARYIIFNNSSAKIYLSAATSIYSEKAWGSSTSVNIDAYSAVEVVNLGGAWLVKSNSRYSAYVTSSYPGYRVIDPTTGLMMQFGISGGVASGSTLTISYPVSFNAIAYPPIITAYNAGTISLDGDNGPLVVTNWSLSSFTVKSTDDANAYSCNYILFGI